MKEIVDKRPLDTMTLDDFLDENGMFFVDSRQEALLRKLCEIVINTHFSKVLDKEELEGVGLAKCVKLFMQGGFNPMRGSLKNYLYTGVRNEIGNYLARSRKEVCYSQEQFAALDKGSGGIEDDIFSVEVDEETIMEVLRGLGKEREASRLRGYLATFGFYVRGEKLWDGVEMEPEGALVLWQMRRKRC